MCDVDVLATIKFCAVPGPAVLASGTSFGQFHLPQDLMKYSQVLQHLQGHSQLILSSLNLCELARPLRQRRLYQQCSGKRCPYQVDQLKTASVLICHIHARLDVAVVCLIVRWEKPDTLVAWYQGTRLS